MNTPRETVNPHPIGVHPRGILSMHTSEKSMVGEIIFFWQVKVQIKVMELLFSSCMAESPSLLLKSLFYSCRDALYGIGQLIHNREHIYSILYFIPGHFPRFKTYSTWSVLSLILVTRV